MYEHLIPLPGGEFSMWRSVCMRMAGLPYDWVSSPDVTRERLFLEALTWQNMEVVRRLRSDREPERRVARTLAGYRARYCAKNDSIGFFGPIGWGSWSDSATKIGQFSPVPRGPIFLELWAVQAVADALVRRHQLDEWALVQLAPAVQQSGDGVYLADGQHLRLSEAQRRVLTAADGFRTLAEVTAESGVPASEIRVLQAMGVLTKGFFVAQTRHPERQLAAQLHRVADPARRASALAELERLVKARDAIRQALGDPVTLAAAISTLDEVFTALTEQVPQRRAGEFYAARTLSFEDCVSELQPELGMELLDGVAPALELLLLSARWFSHRVAEVVLAVARDFAGRPLPALLAHLAAVFAPGELSPVTPAADELRRRWTELLSPGTEPIRLSSAELRARVLAAFPAEGPAWPSARWHTPDLMFAAGTVDDLGEGHLAVLGELHPTINAIDQLSFYAGHPDQVGLRRWIDADMPHRIVPLYQMSDRTVTSQTAPPEAYHSPSYTYLGIGSEPSYAPSRARRVAAGGLHVHDDSGELMVRSVTGGFEAPLVEVLDDYLSAVAYNRFGLLSAAPYRPRIQIDGLVVSRERWQLALDSFPRLREARLDTVVGQLRQLAAQTGLPTHSFWTITGEPKPMYVDLGDAGLVDAVWAKVRRARERAPQGSVTVSEMLPGPEQLWLRDAQGQRYTAEFRLVCVDRQPYRRSDEDVR